MHNGCNSRGPCIRGFVRYVPRKRDGTRGGLVQSRSTPLNPREIPRGSNRSQGENVTPVGASSDGRYITGNKLSEDTQNREEGEMGWMEASDEGFIGGWHKFSMEYCEPVKGDGTSVWIGDAYGKG